MTLHNHPVIVVVARQLKAVLHHHLTSVIPTDVYLTHIYTVNEKPGAMRLRTRGHDFTLPFVKYNFNKS